MAETTIVRPVRGGTARFQSGAALSKLDFTTTVEISSSIFKTADANTVRIVRNVEPESFEPALTNILDPLEGRVRCSAPADNEQWVDFDGPLRTQMALMQLGAIEGVEATLVYNVCFTLPSQVASVGYEHFDELAGIVPGHFHFSSRVGPDRSVLRISSDKRQEIIDIGHCVQTLAKGRIVNLEPEAGSLTQREV